MLDLALSTVDTEWARSWEVLVTPTGRGKTVIPLEMPDDPSALILSPSGPDSTNLALPNGVTLDLRDSQKWHFDAPTDTSWGFANFENAKLIHAIRMDPRVGIWNLQIDSQGKVPFCVHASAFKRRKPPKKGAGSKPKARSKFKCRFCQATLIALALAIAGLVSVVLIPKALIAAVAVYLGIGAVAAKAFIEKMVGFGVDEIALHLCTRAGIC